MNRQILDIFLCPIRIDNKGDNTLITITAGQLILNYQRRIESITVINFCSFCKLLVNRHIILEVETIHTCLTYNYVINTTSCIHKLRCRHLNSILRIELRISHIPTITDRALKQFALCLVICILVCLCLLYRNDASRNATFDISNLGTFRKIPYTRLILCLTDEYCIKITIGGFRNHIEVIKVSQLKYVRLQLTINCIHVCGFRQRFKSLISVQASTFPDFIREPYSATSFSNLSSHKVSIILHCVKHVLQIGSLIRIRLIRNLHFQCFCFSKNIG